MIFSEYNIPSEKRSNNSISIIEAQYQLPTTKAFSRMGVRIGLVFLFMLATSYAGHARELVTADLSTKDKEIRSSSVSVLQIIHQLSEKDVQSSEAIGGNEKVCRSCEGFIAKSLKHLAENKTQTDIMAILHESCSNMHSFKHECINLMDYYGHFLLEISSTQPNYFCRKVNLCEQMLSISKHLSEDSCGFCSDTVVEFLSLLKDPDTQSQIIDYYLKNCDGMGLLKFQCRTLVYQTGRATITTAINFLESNDVCTMFGYCDSAARISQKEFLRAKISMVTTS